MSLTNKLAFCNNDDWNKKLEYLAKNLLPYSELINTAQIYAEFKNIYEEDRSKQEIIISNKISTEFLPIFSYINYFLTDITHVGVDLPTYFNYEKGQPVVMIVGIDPLRSGDELKEKISVGTPYALHSEKFRKDSSLFWSLVKSLANENYTVYLTDTFKMYFNHAGKRSYDISEFTNPENEGFPDVHQCIFKYEVEIIKPDLIVTLGHTSRRWFTNIKEPNIEFAELLKISNNQNHSRHKELYYNPTAPVLPLMHLSGRNQNLTNTYGIVYKDIIPFYTKTIMDKVNSKHD